MKPLIAIFGVAAGLAAAFYFLSRPAGQPAEWPSKKKLRKEARRAKAVARRAAEETPVRPPRVHLEREASTDLKVPLGDLTR